MPAYSILFALKDQNLVSVRDVEPGLACNCTCPECGDSLIAKKGAIYAWHFAHATKADSLKCAETALHLLAKAVLLQEKRVYTPSFKIQVKGASPSGKIIKAEEHVPAMLLLLKNCEDEKAAEGSRLRPDVTAVLADGSTLYVEMCVTHKVDDNKLQKLLQLGVPTLEIVLKDLLIEPTLENVVTRITRDVLHKKWLIAPGQSSLYDEFMDRAYAGLSEAIKAEKLQNSVGYISYGRRVPFTAGAAKNPAARGARVPVAWSERNLKELLNIPPLAGWPSPIAGATRSSVDSFIPSEIWRAAMLFELLLREKGHFKHIITANLLTSWLSTRLNYPTDETQVLLGIVQEYVKALVKHSILLMDKDGWLKLSPSAPQLEKR